ncbi:WD40/YVTN repeat-like-containing domain [Phaffia rhodozyma]|uniref:WD40/YVTN repeat-like-containing domain n=1 Tax=Phaffia rhodozyma TaxID=264483 RepID=A0A0F7SXG6_PHARH|nr:WD40/YVTN repeat-like-containing domain [Phaffia rhodozyma]
MNRPPSVSCRKGPENEHTSPSSGTGVGASSSTINGDNGLGNVNINANGGSNGSNRRQGYTGKRFRTIQPDPSIPLSLPPLLPPSFSNSSSSSSAVPIRSKPLSSSSIATATAKVVPLVAEVMTPRSTGFPIRPPYPFQHQSQSRTQPPLQTRIQSQHRSQPHSYPHVPIPVPTRPPLFPVNGPSGRGFNGQGVPLGPRSHRSNGGYYRAVAAPGGGHGVEWDRAGNQRDGNGTGNGRMRGGTSTRGFNQRSQSSREDGNKRSAVPAIPAVPVAVPTTTTAAPAISAATDDEKQAALDAQEELAVRNSLIMGEDEEDEERLGSKPESELEPKPLQPGPTPPGNRTMTRSVSRSLAATPVMTSPTAHSSSPSVPFQKDIRQEANLILGSNEKESSVFNVTGSILSSQPPPTLAQAQKSTSLDEDVNRVLESGSSRSKTEKIKFKPNTEFRRDTVQPRPLGEDARAESSNKPVKRLEGSVNRANTVDSRKEGIRSSPRLTAKNSVHCQPPIHPLKPLLAIDPCSSPHSKNPPPAPAPSTQSAKAKRPRNRQKPNPMLDPSKKPTPSEPEIQHGEISVDDKVPMDLIKMDTCPAPAIETFDIPPASNDACMTPECQPMNSSETRSSSASIAKKSSRSRKSSVAAQTSYVSQKTDPLAAEPSALLFPPPIQSQVSDPQPAEEKISSVLLNKVPNLTCNATPTTASDSVNSESTSLSSQPLHASHNQQLNCLPQDPLSASANIPSSLTASPCLPTSVGPPTPAVELASNPIDTLLAQISEDIKPNVSLLAIRPKSPTPPPVRPLKGSQPYLKDKLPPDLARALWSNERPEERARARKLFVETKRMELANTDRVVTSKGTWRDDGLALDWKLNTLEGKFTVLLSTEPVSRSELERKHKKILSGKGKDVKAVDWTKDRVVFSWWAKQTEEEEEEGTNRNSSKTDVRVKNQLLSSQVSKPDVQLPNAESEVIPTTELCQSALKAAATPTSAAPAPIPTPTAPRLSRKRRASFKEKLAQNAENFGATSKKNQLSTVQTRQTEVSSQLLPTDISSINPLDESDCQTAVSGSVLNLPFSSSAPASSIILMNNPPSETTVNPPTSLSLEEAYIGDDNDVERLQEEQRELEQRLANCHEKIRQRTQSVAPSTEFQIDSPIPWHQFSSSDPHLLPQQVIVRGMFSEGTTGLMTYLAETGLNVLDCITVENKDIVMITLSNEDEAMWTVANLNGPQRDMPRMYFILAVDAFNQRVEKSPIEGPPRPFKKPKLEEQAPDDTSQGIIGTIPGTIPGPRNQTRLPIGPPAVVLSEKYDFGVGQRPKPDSVSWFVVQDSLLAYTSIKGKVGLYSTKARSCLDEAEIDDLKLEESVSDIVFSGNRIILSRNYHRNHKPASNGPSICPQISFINLRSDITPRIQSCPTAPHAPKGITCLASIPESQLFGRSNFASGGNDGVVQSWSICPEGVATTTRLPAKYHQMEISALSYQPRNSLLFSGAADGTLCTFDLAQNRPGWFGIPKSPGLASISQIHLNEDPNLFCIEYNNSDPFQVYDFRTRPQAVIGLRDPNEMISIAHSRGQFTGNLFLKGTRNGQLKVWDIRKPDKLTTVQLYSSKTMVRQVFLADDRQLFDLAGNKIHARAFSLS